MTLNEALLVCCEAGVRLAVGEDGKLRLTAPSAPPAGVIEVLGQHKAEILHMLAPSPRPVRYPPTELLRELCRWFLAHRADVPRESFRLTPWQQVSDPEKWKDALEDECLSVLVNRPYRGAGLESDLQALKCYLAGCELEQRHESPK